MVVGYRISKAKNSHSVAQMVSGRGGLLAGARWHTAGRTMLYTASSISLATLEIAVHLKGASLLPAYKVLALSIPEDIIETPGGDELPRGWDDRGPPRREVQQWGNDWYDSFYSCVLCVPSAVVPMEHNYLINTEHGDFSKITPGVIEDHPFDPRIKS